MLDDAGSDCQVYDDYYTADIDRFTTLCTSSGVIYGVVWRDDANSYPAVVPLYEEWIDATAEPFKLLSSSEVLGQWVSGAATADNGDARYLCVYEYEEYPVAMVIEGPDDGSTPDACSDAQFLKPADMADLFG
jgi:hypothetical protein